MNVMSLQRRRRADALYDFVEGAAELLASHDEARRCRLENRLLAMLPDLRDTPLFDVLDIRDPALRAMLGDGGDGAFAASLGCHRQPSGLHGLLSLVPGMTLNLPGPPRGQPGDRRTATPFPVAAGVLSAADNRATNVRPSSSGDSGSATAGGHR